MALILSITLAIPIRSYSVSETSKSSFQSYQDERHGIMLQFPLEWKKFEDSRGSWFRNSNESVNVRLEAFPYVGDLDQLAKKYENQTAQQFPGRIGLQSSEAKVGINYTARQFVFDYQEVPYDKSLKSKMKELQLYTIQNHTAFVLTYFTTANEYEYYLPIVQEIVNSVRLNQSS